MLYLDIPTQAQIDRLAQKRNPAAVTIYLAATPLTQESDLTRISLKNHAREALTQLQDAGADKRAITAIEEQLAELDDDEDFWAHQANGLALFVTPDKMRSFRLPTRLEDSVHVSDRFHLKPLLRSISFANQAWVLALAEGGVRLIDVPADGAADEVQVPDLPADAYEAVGRVKLNEGAPNSGNQIGDGKKMRLRQYVRVVGDALDKFLGDSDRPLILAATDPLRSFFRQRSDYAGLTDETIDGNPEHKTPAQLADAARPIIAAHQQAKIATLRDLYADRDGAGRASADMAQIARAAVAGAVDTLLVDMNSVTPGELHDDGSFTLSDTDDAVAYGIADQIALKVREAGGRVIAVRHEDLPDGADGMAAILRWAA